MLLMECRSHKATTSSTPSQWQLTLSDVDKAQIPVTDEKDDIIFWLKQLNDVNTCSTIYENDVLYLQNKK